MAQTPGEKTMQRLFVAIELPDDVRRLLVGRQTGISGVRWVLPENLHLTVRFIGEAPQSQVPAIKMGLRHVSGHTFSLQVKGLGHFDKRLQTILWAGITPSPDLAALKRQVDDSLAFHADMRNDDSRFLPHITLGRTKQTDRTALKAFAPESGLTTGTVFTVESFTLFSSVLVPGGAMHSVEERYPLQGAAMPFPTL